MWFTSTLWVDIVLTIAFLWTLFNLWMHYYYGYWTRKGVHTPKVLFPWKQVGLVYKGQGNIGIFMSDMYHENKQRPYVGLFLLYEKTLMINNIELIKNVLLRDFQHFADHGLGVCSENDPLSNHLFNMDGDVWKALKTKLSPAFTSSKMKYMFDSMLECSKEMENYLEQQVAEGNSVDFRDVATKFNTDIIGSCVFGIRTNSFKHPDTKFRNMGKKAFELNFTQIVRDFTSLFAPSIIKKFKVRLINKDIEDFFVKTVSETIQYREKNNISRNDFLQILIDMKKKDEINGNGKGFSIVDITSQVFLFFIAGYETSSTITSFALYEIAKNPHVQEKLRKEIDTVFEKYEGNFTYEAINEMQYLTQVMEESLRMYPPLAFLFRICTKEYVIPDTDIIIEKGTRIVIPTFGIHRDPDIYKNPNKFDPERYSPENKSKTIPCTNLAFGEGPRMCIGSRFGLMQSKMGLIGALLKFKVALEDKDLDREVIFSSRNLLLSEVGSRYFRFTRIADQ